MVLHDEIDDIVVELVILVGGYNKDWDVVEDDDWLFAQTSYVEPITQASGVNDSKQ